MRTFSIRTADPHSDDAARVTSVITRSFLDDPLVNWIVRQDRRRVQRIARLVHTTVELFMPAGETSIERSGAGCALWVAPSASALSPWKTLRLMGMLGRVAGWRRLMAMAEFYRQFEQLAPAQPAYHLLYLAVAPEARGQGLATALMQPVLQRCDACGLPAYLENSRRVNLPLYERNGFTCTRTWRVAGNGPTLWCMYREPQ